MVENQNNLRGSQWDDLRIATWLENQEIKSLMVVE